MPATDFQDYPLAGEDREWDSAAAEKRIRKWAGADDGPNAKYRDAHLWYDGDKPDNFTSYKMPYADVVDGKVVAVPRAIISAAGVIDGARGGVDIPKSDVDKVKQHLAKYYGKMGATPPWES